MDLEIPMEEGEPLGATPNDKLIITKIQGGTIADGKLKIGDQILKVNGQPISDQNNFFKALRLTFQSTSFCSTIGENYDPEKKAEELEARVRIPEARAKLIQRRDGYMYFLAKLVWQPNGPKLGLGIKHFQNRVLVSRCDAGSLSATQLAVGDHIIDIDGVPVTDKDVARDLLIKALQEKKEVTAVVERPESMEAKHWTQQALVTQICQPPSVQMNSDVRAIAARERAKVKQPKPVWYLFY
ncbi:PDZ/DHR/GLGF domain protein [Ostertagia ostertagi]